MRPTGALVRATHAWLVALALAACGDRAAPVPAAPAPSAAPLDAAPPIAVEPAPCATCRTRVVAALPAKRALGLAIDDAGTTAYIAELFGNHIFAVALATGEVRTLYTSPSRGTWGVQIVGDDVLWSSNDTGALYAAPRAGGGAIRTIAANLVGVGAFRVVGDTLFWCDTGGGMPGAVWRRPLAGGPSVAIATPARQIADIEAVGDDLIAIDDTGGRVFRIAPATGTLSAWLALGADAKLEGIAADGAGAIYVASLAGRVVRIDAATARAERVVDEAGSLFAGVAFDRAHRVVYWVDYLRPRLLALAHD